MTYQVIGASATDANFQNRVKGAIISLAADIINAVGDTAITNNAGVGITTLACKNLAKNFCKGTSLFRIEAAAMLMLLNYDIAANPATVIDATINYQTKEIWLTLVEIG